ncbi:hypothetical protein F5148DRAFT_1291306 [Russula earlei]|uniref:Uncharacterized protein n=1 Tax=Russula earlei TaxID=71964 RepID=A0ACC0TWS8_9AGAM|nr:hypothetical protein F5148DRAFT_1291306 [Russula earlei]
MSQLDILSTPRAIHLITAPYLPFVYIEGDSVHDGGGGNDDDDDDDDRIILPGLPRLLHGHPDVHLRNDLSHVYNPHQRWTRCLPEIDPFYAVKCNPDSYVLRLLAELGLGFDCASNAEISQAESFVKNAATHGIDMMTFDNADELYKIARANPMAKLVLRIFTDDSKSFRLGLKFGAPLVSVPGLLAKENGLGFDVIGISF